MHSEVTNFMKHIHIFASLGICLAMTSPAIWEKGSGFPFQGTGRRIHNGHANIKALGL